MAARIIPIIIQVQPGAGGTAVITQFTNAFKQLDREVQNTSHSAAGLSFKNLIGAEAIGSLVSNAFSRLTSVFLEGARAVFEYSARLEQTKIAFTTLLGSSTAATQHLKDLQKFALETPFEFEGLVDASRRMQALGFSSKEVIPILKDVGNAVAAVGGSREILDRVVLALSQIQTKGKVMAQEMNQLAEAGIPAWRILSEALGKSTAEVIQLAEKGEISSKVFLDAFQKFSQTNFGGMMEKQAKTFQGAMSNIKDTLLLTASTAFEPLFRRISEIADRVQQELVKVKDLEGVVPILIDGFSQLGGTLGTVLAQAIGAKLVSPSFWLSYGSVLPRVLAEAIKGADSVLTDSLREAVSGRKPGEVTAYDRVLADVQVQNKSKLDVAEANLQRLLKETTAITKDNTAGNKEAEKVLEGLYRKILDVSGASLEMATRQQFIRAGVADLNEGYAALAINLARTADAAALAWERQQAEETRVRNRNDSLRASMERLREGATIQIAELAAAARGGLTPLEQFNLGLGSQAEAAETLTEDLNATRGALENLTKAQRAAQINADATKNATLRQALIEETARDLAALGQGLDRLTNGRRSTELDRTVESLIRMKGLRLKQEDFDPLIQLVERAGQNPEGLRELTDGIRKLFSFSGAPGIGDGDIDRATAQIANFLLTGARASTLAGAAIDDLNRQIEESENAVAIASETAALRYKLAWQDAENAVALANDAAFIRRLQNQVFLAHQMEVDFARLNDGVVDFLAQQKTLQQTFQDVRTNTVRSFFDGIDSAIDKMTKRLGVAGSVLSSFLKDLAHLAASTLLRRLLGLGGSAGVQISGGGGGVFGGGGGGVFGGGGGIFGGGILNFLGGGARSGGGAFGITAPASLSSQQGGGFTSLANAAFGSLGNSGGGSAGLLSGLAGSLGPIAPLLGAGLGASLGGGSMLGQVLGGIGGGILGLGGAALLGSSSAAGVLGSIGSLGGLLGFALPVLPIAAALLVGAIILAKNAQRRKEEKVRNQASLDTLPAVYEILFAAQRGELTVGQARSQWDQVHNQYLQSIAGIKDGKTKRHAQMWWDNDVTPIWKQIETAAKSGEQAKLVSQHLVPEFASGGFVPYRGGMATLIKVQPGELMIPPGGSYAYGGIVPGVDRGVDSVYTMARPGTRVLTKSQQAAARGFARGGIVGGTDGARGDAGPIVVNVYLDDSIIIGKEDSGRIFTAGAATDDGKKATVNIFREARRDKEI